MKAPGTPSYDGEVSWKPEEFVIIVYMLYVSVKWSGITIDSRTHKNVFTRKIKIKRNLGVILFNMLYGDLFANAYLCSTKDRCCSRVSSASSTSNDRGHLDEVESCGTVAIYSYTMTSFSNKLAHDF